MDETLFISDTLANKFSALSDMQNKIDELQFHRDTLEEDIISCIINGESSGDDMQDFVIVAHSTAEPEQMSEYHELIQLTKSPGLEIAVIQVSYFILNDKRHALRCISLARTREGEVTFDVQNQKIILPVEPNFFYYMEVKRGDRLYLGYNIIKKNHIKTGPLKTSLTKPCLATREGDKVFTPSDAVACMRKLPLNNMPPSYKVSDDLIKDLNARWRRSRFAVVCNPETRHS